MGTILLFLGLAAIIALLLRNKGEFEDLFFFIGCPCAAILLLVLHYSPLGNALGF